MDNFNCISPGRKIIRICLFFILGIVIMGGMAVLSAVPGANRFFAAASGADLGLCTGYGDVTPSICKVQEQSTAKKLILGDSVCKQLFSGLQEQNEEYCIAGTYCTVGISGQYILAYEFLESHPDASDIYLMIRPQSVSAQLDSQKAYMYAVAPFAVTGTINRLDEATINQMREMYWSYGINQKTASLIVNSPMLAKIYLNKLQAEHFVENQPVNGVSEISLYYLRKLAQLCEERGVRLHLYAIPLPDNDENHYMVDNIIVQAKGTGTERLIEELCQTVVYCDEAYFLDGQHFDSEQIGFTEVIQWMQEKNDDLWDLELGE